MRAVDLNFASSPFRNNTPYYLGYGLGIVALVAFTSYNVYAFMTYSKNQAVLETDYAQKKTRLEALYEQSGKLTGEITKRDIGTLNERAKFTNDLLDRRRFSWTALLNSLEEVQPYQVRMLSLRPIIQQKGILIDARAVAKDLQAFWNFQQNLMAHPKFRRVYPAGYLKSDEAGEFIFNLAFNYFPDGAPPEFAALTPEDVAKSGIVQAPGSNPGGLAEEDLQSAVEHAAPAPSLPNALGHPGGPPPAANRPPAGSVALPPSTIVQNPAAAPPRGASPGPPSARDGAQPQPPGVRPLPAPVDNGGQVVGAPAGQLSPPAAAPGAVVRSKMRPPRVPLHGNPPPPAPDEPKRRRIPLDPPPPSDGDATSEDDNQ